MVIFYKGDLTHHRNITSQHLYQEQSSSDALRRQNTKCTEVGANSEPLQIPTSQFTTLLLGHRDRLIKTFITADGHNGGKMRISKIKMYV